MYRCYFLARIMLVFELVAIFAPEEITIDPFELFKTKGGLIFNAWCGPTGFAGEALFRFTAQYISYSWKLSQRQSPRMKLVAEAWVKF